MNLFEKQQKPFAIKLSDRVKEEIKKTFGSDWYDKASEKGYFHYPNFENCKGFKEMKHTSIGIEYGYTLITEAEFFGDGNNKLRGKFENLTFDIIHTDCDGDIAIASGKCTENNAITIEQINDDFAVKFAEWMYTDTTFIGGMKYRVINDEKHYTLTELLQIFKNEHYE